MSKAAEAEGAEKPETVEVDATEYKKLKLESEILNLIGMIEQARAAIAQKQQERAALG